MDRSEQAAGDRGPGVPSAWLREFQSTQASKSLERLNADLEVINDLRIDGFVGARWEAFAHILLGYSFQVLTTWIRRGVVFEKCSQKGIRHFSGTPKLRRFPYDEAEDLAQEVLREAIDHFRDDVLLPGKWDPRKGASLKTYFIGQCLLRFPGCYARWYSNYAKHAPAHRAGVVQLDPNPTDPATIAIRRAHLAHLFRDLDRETRAIVELRAQKYRLDEIAELLETSVPAIKSRLHRLKKRMQEGGAA
jgi:DNA-directed RNA polymerase specialized sigma24 family protein